MKLSELKKIFRHKYMIRIVAGVLVVTMVGTGMTAYGAIGKEKASEGAVVQNHIENEINAAENTDETLSEALSSSINWKETEVGKEETVYIIADSTGTPTRTIVSNHLINNDNSAVLEDVSTLTDIENVKGEETFTQNGTKINWQADGNDIFYQGTTEEQPPVTEKLTYYLDGKEIAPEELAGKSGKVTIRFDYTNHAKVTAEIAGEEAEVCVPFVAISGMILDDSFSDIEVTNGKVMADGSRNLVIGYALPGLKESLNVNEDDFDTEINIPDYFEVTAEVENFSLDMTMTAIVNAADFISADGENDLSSVDDMIDTLTDAASRLEEGSGELADGLDTLQSRMGEFTDGVSTLKTGIMDYTDGVSQVADGIGTLKNNTPQLSDGISQLRTGITAIYDNFGSTDNQNTIRGGAGSLSAGADQLLTGADALSAGAAEVSSGAAAVDGAVGQLADGADALSAGAAELAAGVNELVTQVNGMAVQMTTAASNLANTKAALLSQCGVSTREELSALIASVEGQLAEIKSGFESTDDISAKNSYMEAYSQTSAALDSLKQAQAAIEVLDTVLTQLPADFSSMSGQLEALNNGAASVAGGAGQISGGLNELKTGTSALSSGASQVSEGADSLKGGAAALKTGAGSLASGVEQLYLQAIVPVNAGMNQLAGSMPVLVSGVDQLNTGAAELVKNNTALNDGADRISDAAGQLADGVKQLDNGAHQLADGIVTFNESGIDEIVNAYQGDLKPLMERIQAVLDAGADYQSFTGIKEDVSGSVKFVYKTTAVE